MYCPGLITKRSGAVVPDAERVVSRRRVDGDRHRLRFSGLQVHLLESDQSLGGLSLHGNPDIYLNYLRSSQGAGIGHRCGHGHRRIRTVGCVHGHVGDIEGGVGQAKAESEQRLDALRLEPAVPISNPSE